MPVLCTRMRTSLIDISGSGTSRRSRPGPAVDFTSACIDRAYSRGPVPGGVVRGSGARSPLVHVRPVDDRVLDRADALDVAAHPIAGLEEDRWVPEDADSRWCASRDHVAGLERDGRRDERDERRNVPDHVGRRGILHLVLLAVARDPPAPEAEATRRVDLVRRNEHRPHREERVAALRAKPLAIALLALPERRGDALPVTCADIVHDDVAGDVRHRFLDRDASRLFGDHDAELDLEIERVGPLWTDDRFPVCDDRVRELREEQGAIGTRAAAFSDVILVVQPDAHDLPGPGHRGCRRQLGRVRRYAVDDDPAIAIEGSLDDLLAEGPGSIREE